MELFDKIIFELEEIGRPLPIKWGKCTLETASYGHGVTTTPLQLAKAYATLVNGGYKINPTLIKNKFKNKKKKQKISKKTKKLVFGYILSPPPKKNG